MTATTNESGSTLFYLSPFCCICLERYNLYRLDSCETNDMSYRKKLSYCFPEKEIDHDNNILRYICKDCTDMVTMTFSFKQLYYRNTTIRQQYLQEFENLNKKKYNNLSVIIEDVKPYLSPENTVQITVFDPSEGSIVIENHTDYVHYNEECTIEIKEEILDEYDEFQPVHEENVYENKVEECFLGFPSVEVKCITCNIPINNKHFLLKTNETPEKQYTCDICNKSFPMAHRLHNHRQTHKDRYACEFCNSKFVRLENFEQHVKNHNPQMKCPICPKLLTKTYYLHKHLKTHHSIEKCTKCNQIHVSQQKCKTKVTIATAVCQHCDKLITKGELHNCGAIATTTNTKCLICDEEITNGEQHICVYSEKCFKCNHIIKERNKKHLCKTFKCLMCPKEFLKKPYLNNHLRFHVVPKKYKCTYCYKKFHKPELLRRHLKKHLSK